MPAGTSRSSPSTAVMGPKRFVTARNRRAMSACRAISGTVSKAPTQPTVKGFDHAVAPSTETTSTRPHFQYSGGSNRARVIAPS